jgi:RNA polymerase sigma factor (sigma-70 family)
MSGSGCQRWGDSGDTDGRKRLGSEDRNDDRLASLNDDDLIEEIQLAREAGDQQQIRKCLGRLAWSRYDYVLARVQLKISETYAEDVAQEVMMSALKASFDGNYIGEFGSMLNTIIRRRIADFHSKPRLETDPLVEENSDDENTWGEVPSSEDFSGARDSLSVIEAALEELSERHRMVVRLTMDGYRAKEVADRVNSFYDDESAMTDANVHQIMKRFRDDLDDQLEGRSEQ